MIDYKNLTEKEKELLNSLPPIIIPEVEVDDFIEGLLALNLETVTAQNLVDILDEIWQRQPPQQRRIREV